MEFEAIVREFSPMLFNHIRRMIRHEEDAQDILQEVLLLIYRKQHTFKGDSSFKTWIFRIASNRTIDFIRKERKVITEGYDDTFSSESCPHDAADRVVHSDILNRALQQITPEHREIVILKEVDGFTFKEIADIKNMPENTVKTKLYSTLKQLKQLIEEGGNQ